MKDFITPSYTFTPAGSGVGAVTLNIESFDVRRLVAIINQTRGVVIYSTADPNARFTNLSDSTLTLNVDTSTHASSDILQVIYNDPFQDDMQEFMYEMLKRLDFLSTLRGSDGTIRAGIISGTLPTVTTVGTVSSVTAVASVSNVAAMTGTIGGFSTNTIAPNLMNSNAVLANINNVIVT
jgi:hypothetical protein